VVIDKSTGGGKTVFALTGRLDTVTAPDLEKALIPAFDENKDIVLNFKDLVYISSAGLRVILVASKAAKSKGGSLVLTNMSDGVREVFEITGFSEIVTIE
jgi:anti-anti-sigma factor